MAHGPYDPGAQFLFDTMHNPSVPIRRRIKCAKALLELEHREPTPADISLKVIIQGLPEHASVSVSTEREDISKDQGPGRLN